MTDSEGTGDNIGGVCVVTQPARRQTGKTHAYQLLDILAASTSVSLLTANLDPNSGIREDYEVIEVTSSGIGDNLAVTIIRFLFNQLRMAQAILDRDEEIVLFFGATAYLFPIIVAKAGGKTVVLQPRGNVPLSLRLKWANQVPVWIARVLAGIVSGLERIGYRLSDGIVTYTPSMAEELDLDRYGEKLYTDGIRFVDLDRFSIETPVAERPMTVGYLGRLDVEKNVPLLVEVAKQLPGDVGFRFVGDGDYRDVVERELADEIQAGDVTVTGWVDHEEVPRELNRMRLLLLTSEPTEGLPTAILEAFACGTPVYASPVAGVPDVVREGETGALLTEDDPAAIATRIETSLEDGSLLEWSEACRQLADSEFHFDAAVERYRSMLEQVRDR